MFLKLFSIALTIFLAVDAIWLTVVAKSFYAKHLGFLMTPTPNLLVAGLFYLLFIVGLVIFVILPAVIKNEWAHALTYGAVFGLVCYATYDLTNLATLKNWPMIVTIVDLLWGMTISALVSVLTFFLAKNVLK